MEADKEFREWQPTFIKQFNVLKRFSDVEIKLLKSKIKFKLRFIEEGALSLSS